MSARGAPRGGPAGHGAGHARRFRAADRLDDERRGRLDRRALARRRPCRQGDACRLRSSQGRRLDHRAQGSRPDAAGKLRVQLPAPRRGGAQQLRVQARRFLGQERLVARAARLSVPDGVADRDDPQGAHQGRVGLAADSEARRSDRVGDLERQRRQGHDLDRFAPVRGARARQSVPANREGAGVELAARAPTGAGPRRRAEDRLEKRARREPMADRRFRAPARLRRPAH